MKPVYLDYAATTPLDAEVSAAMQPYFSELYGNPSSMHASGRRAARAISGAREQMATLIGAHADEIIFTGSGTESDNLGVLGAARANRARGTHIIISAIEHKAVMAAAKELAKEGFEVTIAPVGRTGMISCDALVALVRPDTILVSVMLANNELGTVLPVAELAKKLKARRGNTSPLLHTDACQAAGHVKIDVGALGVDLLTLNGSKVYGPKGIGVLYKRRGVQIAPVIVGGEQEQGLRAGTESVPLIMGMAAAFEKAEHLREQEAARLGALRNYFIANLRTHIPQIILNGDPEHHVPHIVHVTVPRVEGESMVLMLDEAGVEAATGSACSAKDLKPSHVLIAIGQSEDLMHGSVRFSLGRHTTEAELDYVLSVFPAIVETLTKTSALTILAYANQPATL